MQRTVVLRVLHALAHPTRMSIMQALVREKRGMAAGEIAARLAQKQSTLSSHLAVLLQVGLVDADRDGRKVIYSRDAAALRTLCRQLIEDLG
jgi:ArsR family transcriptional regulator, arsenate/arsenite/antimonite-responsive transcriptional repressor